MGGDDDNEKPKAKERSASLVKLVGSERLDLIEKRQHEKIHLRYFWDVNTVEMTLLGCGIIVSLSGIMFETIPPEEEDFYQPHIYFVTVICLTTLIFSVFYWIGVFSSEIAGYRCQRFKRLFGEENFITRGKKRQHLMGDVVSKLKIEPKKKNGGFGRRLSVAFHGAAHALHLDAVHIPSIDERTARRRRKEARRGQTKIKGS